MNLHVRIRPDGLSRFSLIIEADKPLVQRAVAKALPRVQFEIAEKVYIQGAAPHYFTVIFQIENVEEFDRVITFIENEGSGQGLCIKPGDFYMKHGTYENVFDYWKTLQEVGQVLF